MVLWILRGLFPPSFLSPNSDYILASSFCWPTHKLWKILLKEHVVGISTLHWDPQEVKGPFSGLAIMNIIAFLIIWYSRTSYKPVFLFWLLLPPAFNPYFLFSLSLCYSVSLIKHSLYFFHFYFLSRIFLTRSALLLLISLMLFVLTHFLGWVSHFNLLLVKTY